MSIRVDSERFVRDCVGAGVGLRQVAAGQVESMKTTNRALSQDDAARLARLSRLPDRAAKRVLEALDQAPCLVLWHEAEPDFAVLDVSGDVRIEAMSGQTHRLDARRVAVSLGSGLEGASRPGDAFTLIRVTPGGAAARDCFYAMYKGEFPVRLRVDVYTTEVASPSPTLPLSLPPFDMEVDLQKCAPWMQEEVRALLAAPSPFQRLAGLGLLARLWYVAPHADAPRAIPGERGPASRLREWARALSPESVDALDRLAAGRCAELQDELDALAEVELSMRDRRATSLRALAVLRHRDDLESVAYMLREARAQGQPEPAIDVELARVDRSASLHASLFECADDTFWTGAATDPRLQEVAWQEPLAWWGTFAVAD